MDVKLSPVEIRVLGCLMEKEVVTPDQYPLSLYALTAACNQKTNREPVMELREEIVTDALENLRSLRLAWRRHTTGSRVEKFAHAMKDRFKLDQEESAVLALLFLRGPQTPGELRSRTSRLAEFRDPSHVEEVLQRLAADEQGPFVGKMPRTPGTREDRWAHLFSGELPSEGTATPSSRAVEPAGSVQEEAADRPAVRVRTRGPSEEDRISALERQVRELRGEIEQIRSALVRLTDPVEGSEQEEQ